MGSSKKPQDATRQERKAKKRKLEDAVPDLPGDVEDAKLSGKAAKKKRKRTVDEDVIEEKENEERKKDKKRRKKEAEAADAGEGGEGRKGTGGGDVGKKEKKSKKDKTAKSSAISKELEGEDKVETVEEDAEPKKSKKERKAERKAKEAAQAAAAGKSDGTATIEGFKSKKGEQKANGSTTTDRDNVVAEGETKSKKNNRNREKKRKGHTAGSAEGALNREEKAVDGNEKEKKDARFICFIGNLPFTANTTSITTHFAAVKPISVRALTKKDDSSKCKGCAFIEFEGYDHMKTCLKMFHHSMFDDGVSAPRKINVELTAGGGGNTKERKAKIQEKNDKLNEQRVRRIQEEATAKLDKSNSQAAIDESAIHPSRRARVPVA